MLTWPAGGGAEDHERTARPFLCHSYRCRRCGPWVAAGDYRRVEAAALSRPWWLYAVLTFDPAGWGCAWDAYRGAADLWELRLRKRLEREVGRVEYVQTFERHTRGQRFPHVNLLLGGVGLRAAVEREGVERRLEERAGHGRGRVCAFPRWRTSWLAKHAPACGYGLRVWAEVVDSREGMAAYLAKAAHDLTAARFKDGDQTPIGAPPGFRRLRASRGLLPPRPKGDGVWTGAISTTPLDAFLDKGTGELAVPPVAVQLAIDAREKAAAWLAAHGRPEPEYERALDGAPDRCHNP